MILIGSTNSSSTTTATTINSIRRRMTVARMTVITMLILVLLGGTTTTVAVAAAAAGVAAAVYNCSPCIDRTASGSGFSLRAILLGSPQQHYPFLFWRQVQASAETTAKHLGVPLEVTMYYEDTIPFDSSPMAQDILQLIDARRRPDALLVTVPSTQTVYDAVIQVLEAGIPVVVLHTTAGSGGGGGSNFFWKHYTTTTTTTATAGTTDDGHDNNKKLLGWVGAYDYATGQMAARAMLTRTMIDHRPVRRSLFVHQDEAGSTSSTTTTFSMAEQFRGFQETILLEHQKELMRNSLGNNPGVLNDREDDLVAGSNSTTVQELVLVDGSTLSGLEDEDEDGVDSIVAAAANEQAQQQLARIFEGCPWDDIFWSGGSVNHLTIVSEWIHKYNCSNQTFLGGTIVMMNDFDDEDGDDGDDSVLGGMNDSYYYDDDDDDVLQHLFQEGRLLFGISHHQQASLQGHLPVVLATLYLTTGQVPVGGGGDYSSGDNNMFRIRPTLWDKSTFAAAAAKARREKRQNERSSTPPSNTTTNSSSSSTSSTSTSVAARPRGRCHKKPRLHAAEVAGGGATSTTTTAHHSPILRGSEAPPPPQDKDDEQPEEDHGASCQGSGGYSTSATPRQSSRRTTPTIGWIIFDEDDIEVDPHYISTITAAAEAAATDLNIRLQVLSPTRHSMSLPSATANYSWTVEMESNNNNNNNNESGGYDSRGASGGAEYYKGQDETMTLLLPDNDDDDDDVLTTTPRSTPSSLWDACRPQHRGTQLDGLIVALPLQTHVYPLELQRNARFNPSHYYVAAIQRCLEQQIPVLALRGNFEDDDSDMEPPSLSTTIHHQIRPNLHSAGYQAGHEFARRVRLEDNHTKDNSNIEVASSEQQQHLQQQQQQQQQQHKVWCLFTTTTANACVGLKDAIQMVNDDAAAVASSVNDEANKVLHYMEEMRLEGARMAYFRAVIQADIFQATADTDAGSSSSSTGTTSVKLFLTDTTLLPVVQELLLAPRSGTNENVLLPAGLTIAVIGATEEVYTQMDAGVVQFALDPQWYSEGYLSVALLAGGAGGVGVGVGANRLEHEAVEIQPILLHAPPPLAKRTCQANSFPMCSKNHDESSSGGIDKDENDTRHASSSAFRRTFSSSSSSIRSNQTMWGNFVRTAVAGVVVVVVVTGALFI